MSLTTTPAQLAPRSALARAFLPALVSLGLAAPLIAQHQAPGSLLVFPEIDKRAGHTTFLSVARAGGTGLVAMRFVFIDSTSCGTRKRSFNFTPSDRQTVSVNAVATGLQRGFAYAYAVDPVTFVPLSLNEFVGVATHLQGTPAVSYTISALSFQSPIAAGQTTDVDADDIRDLNGIEYTAAPDRIIVPHFVGVNASAPSDLVLIGLTGSSFTTTASIIVCNDNEELFSAQVSFGCWSRVAVASISQLFTNSFLVAGTNHSPTDSWLNGSEVGWFEIRGTLASSGQDVVNDPAILAVLMAPEADGNVEWPYATGTRSNGDLFVVGATADGN